MIEQRQRSCADNRIPTSHQPGDCRDRHRAGNERLLATAPERIHIAPCRELEPWRLADADELQALREARQADLIGRGPYTRRAILALALLDGLPALLDRRQVPAAAPGADDPQTSVRTVEREPPANGQLFDDLIRAE